MPSPSATTSQLQGSSNMVFYDQRNSGPGAKRPWVHAYFEGQISCQDRYATKEEAERALAAGGPAPADSIDQSMTKLEGLLGMSLTQKEKVS